MNTIFYQYRTFDTTYLFTIKNKEKITCKAFDVFQQYISKTTHFVDKVLLKRSIEEKTLHTLLTSKFIPSSHRVTDSLNTRQIEKNIAIYIRLLEFEIATGTKLEDLLTCPITQELFKETIYDNHGHTFEKNEY